MQSFIFERQYKESKEKSHHEKVFAAHKYVTEQ
jgi:hypothetical protein